MIVMSVWLVIVPILFVAAVWCLLQVVRKPRVRQRLLAYWWAWLPFAVIALVGNELFDRRGNGGGHPLGDVAVAVVVVGIVFSISGAVARQKSTGGAT